MGVGGGAMRYAVDMGMGCVTANRRQPGRAMRSCPAHQLREANCGGSLSENCLAGGQREGLPPTVHRRGCYKNSRSQSTTDNFFTTSSFSFFIHRASRIARSNTASDSMRCCARHARQHLVRWQQFSSLRLHPPKDDNHINVFFSQLIRP